MFRPNPAHKNAKRAREPRRSIAWFDRYDACVFLVMHRFSSAYLGALALFALAACGSGASSAASLDGGRPGASSKDGASDVIADAGPSSSTDAPFAPDDAAASSLETVVSYTPDATTVFASPERGFYHHTETTSAAYSPLDEATLVSFRTGESITHVLRVFYLDSFVDADIASSYLASMRADFATARRAGVKVIVRFAYTASETGEDASPSRVLSHIAQLKPILTDNVDVIEVAQAGFVGAWGEGYYTTSFGNASNVTATDWANRKSVVDALLDALPSGRMVQLRTPRFKRTMYGDAPLTSAEAFTGTARARLGHHDDAFVASDDDMGTYVDPAVEVPYVATESPYLPVGGENDAYAGARTACPSAIAEMARLHWSFINIDYLDTTIANWKSQGCYDVMRQKLGYRISLISGRFSATTHAGTMHLSITLRNDGYASPFNPRPVELLLRAKATSAIYRYSIATDPRRWSAGTTSTIDTTLTVNDVSSGEYDLFLMLPDDAPSLRDRPEYAVRFANAGTWDDALGANALFAKFTVP